jgi:hypothetical protein
VTAPRRSIVHARGGRRPVAVEEGTPIGRIAVPRPGGATVVHLGVVVGAALVAWFVSASIFAAAVAALAASAAVLAGDIVRMAASPAIAGRRARREMPRTPADAAPDTRDEGSPTEPAVEERVGAAAAEPELPAEEPQAAPRGDAIDARVVAAMAADDDVASVLASAQQAAERMRGAAREDAERGLVDARAEAERAIEAAGREAQRLQADADAYGTRLRAAADRYSAERRREADELAALTLGRTDEVVREIRAAAAREARALVQAARREARSAAADTSRSADRVNRLHAALESMTAELAEALPPPRRRGA